MGGVVKVIPEGARVTAGRQMVGCMMPRITVAGEVVVIKRMMMERLTVL